ncbi:MAG: hypothetical protein RLZZ293_603 [Pseudomonadota bacterium]
MLFNATYAEELRVAAVDGQKLINFDIETSSKEQRRGNIYKGIITRVEPSLEACFIDYGTDKQGFLPFKEIDYRYLVDANGQKYREFAKLPVGTELIVQVEKDERGNKGAALTSYITLPGRYLVLMPNNPRAGGISRRIEGEERDELKSLMSQLDIPQGMSVILRTAALGRVIEELQWDLTYLLKLWSAIRSAVNEQQGAFLIYQESSLVIRSIRDHFSPDIAEILIDTEDVYIQAKQFMAHVMPNFAERIKLYRDDVPLFSRFQIEHQIESAYSRMVNLPSGGAIVIDHTEALTSVDVNSAKANKGADIETTAFLTNLEAAEEIARQLRLRDLGGLVVVDFIDMENPRNQRDLENHFKNQLGYDRARIQMGKLSKFGLLELSRQRLQASLDESSNIPCPRCAGVGTIRGIESSALHILRIIQEETIKYGAQLSALHVQLPVDVATYLLNERRDDVAKIEARMKVKIVLIPNVHLVSPNYKIKKLTYDHYDSNFAKSSYNLVEMPEESLGYKTATKKSDLAPARVPVVTNIAPAEPAPVIAPRKKASLLAKLVTSIKQLFTSDSKNKKRQKSKVMPSNNRNNKVVKRNIKAVNEVVPAEKNEKNEKPVVTKSNLQERTINSGAQNLSAKVRPVTVAKQNSKIQTVRPNNKPTNDQATNVREQNERQEVKVNRVERVVKNNNTASSKGVATVPAKANVNVVASSAPQRKNNTPVVKISAQAITVIQDRLNVADKSALQYTIFASSASGAAINTVVNAPQKVVDNLQSEKPTKLENDLNTSLIKHDAVLEVKNDQIKLVPNLTVDLGDLVLVATNPELLNQYIEPVIDTKVTRFCDIIRETNTLSLNEIDYQQIETRKI